MEDTFEFICPTKIYYRPEGVSEIGRIIKEDYRFSRVFFVSGGTSKKRMALMRK